MNGRKKNSNLQQRTRNYYIIPLIITLCIIPFVVKLTFYNPYFSGFTWFSNSESQADFFLYYKQWFFVATTSVMTLIIIIKAFFDRKSIQFVMNFIPLVVYAILALVSSIASKYASFSFTGSFEQFESVFALVGYCITVYYAFLFIKSEHDIKIIFQLMVISVFIMSLLGVFQSLGYDFFATELGKKLIVPDLYRNSIQLDFTFGLKRVYMTLYNPNYVGVYVALVAPVIAVMLLFEKNRKYVILSAVTLIGLIICIVGARSLAGMIGIGVASITIVIFMRRPLIKKYYITAPIIIVLVIGLIVTNVRSDNFFVDKLFNSLTIHKTEVTLTDLHTEEDGIALTYREKSVKIKYMNEAGLADSFEVSDELNQLLPLDYDDSTNTYRIIGDNLEGITLGMNSEIDGVFYVEIQGYQYMFTNQYEDMTYHYLNRYGKLDKMITAPSTLFTGYESLATGRGYIWSRTIPMIKDYIILGSGPDTFTMTFPQQDYMNLSRYTKNELLTKPHNLYLQIAIQTGFLSLLAFLTFYGMYFITSIRLYIKGIFNSYYAKAGIAIFVSTISYMVAGLTNDSSICTAPVFWTLIGIGIAANHKAKPLILKELAKL